MRNFILMMQTSLDTKVARPDGDLSWFVTDPEQEAASIELLNQVDAMIFGRVAYDLLAEFWPTAADAPEEFSSPERAKEFAYLLNTIPKIVVSHEPHDLPWGPAESVHGDVVGALRTMKASEGRDLVAFAGVELATTVIDAGLVDEYRLVVHPIVLGEGLPLFDRVRDERSLELLEVLRFPSGLVELRYRDPEVAA